MFPGYRGFLADYRGNIPAAALYLRRRRYTPALLIGRIACDMKHENAAY